MVSYMVRNLTPGKMRQELESPHETMVKAEGQIYYYVIKLLSEVCHAQATLDCFKGIMQINAATQEEMTKIERMIHLKPQ